MLQIMDAGSTRLPDRTLLLGVKGVGKSTWAANAPAPFFLNLEKRLAHVRNVKGETVKCAPGETWEDVLAFIREFPCEQFKTAVIDTIDGLEILIHRFLMDLEKVQSIEEIGGGYGKGYTRTMEQVRELVIACDILRAKGIEIIFLGHTQVKNFKNPDGPDYDRYIAQINDKLAAYLSAWADNVLLACYDDTLIVKKGDKGGVHAKGKAVGNDQKRIVRCQRTPAFEAKNHYSLPEKIPLSYAKFDELRKGWLEKNGAPEKQSAKKEETKQAVKEQQETKKPARSIEETFELMREAAQEYAGLASQTPTQMKADFWPNYGTLADACKDGQSPFICTAMEGVYHKTTQETPPKLAAAISALIPY